MMSADEVVKSWMEGPRRVAHQLIKKYGQPNETSSNMLIWYNNGPWKRTELRNEELTHNFPMPHKDMLESIIDYQVPPGKASDLEMFDGSVLFDRTAGEMSARCDAEGANFLALNLAHEIITGKRSIEEAREEYGKQIQAMKQGQPGPYVQDFQFEVPKGGTADPDSPVMKAA